MDDCAPSLSESDAQTQNSTLTVASAKVSDKLINNKKEISSHVRGGSSATQDQDELCTDDYCHLCDAVLLFEPQRQSHYEGKKHAQKLKLHLQNKAPETTSASTPVVEQTLLTDDENKFCQLCNMVFSSPVVAKSHYQGKIHLKNLRKQNLENSDAITKPSPSLVADSSSTVDNGERTEEQRTSSQVDLKDPNNYCTLCSASFNSPQTASQHYNGRKHQKNEARLRQLEDSQVTSPAACKTCSMQCNSVKSCQTHIQQSKHDNGETKVVDKPPQKQYSTFADELADYIQVQKARGVTPATGQFSSATDREQQDVGAGISQPSSLQPEDSSRCAPPHHSYTAAYCPGESPAYQGPSWLLQGWYENKLSSDPPDSAGFLPTAQNLKRKRRRRQSSSSYSSSSFDSTSDTDDSEDQQGEKKKRSRRSRESDEARRRKHRKRDQEFKKERSKKHKKHGKQRRQEKPLQGNAEKEKTKERVDNRTEEERLWDDSILGF